MFNNLKECNIRIFVFGTLRMGEKYDFYMEGTQYKGKYYTRGQLMESSLGSAYIDFDANDAATIGEVYEVDYYCLQRINHLENTWGEFPKGYFLDIIPVWVYDGSNRFSFNDNKKIYAFGYRRKEASKVLSGDWTRRKDSVVAIGALLKGEREKNTNPDELISQVLDYIEEV